MDITKSGSCALIIKIPIWLLDSPFFLKGAPKKLHYFLNALYKIIVIFIVIFSPLPSLVHYSSLYLALLSPFQITYSFTLFCSSLCISYLHFFSSINLLCFALPLDCLIALLSPSSKLLLSPFSLTFLYQAKRMFFLFSIS